MQARVGVLSRFHDILRDLGFLKIHIMASVFKVAGGGRHEEGEGKVHVSSVSWGRV